MRQHTGAEAEVPFLGADCRSARSSRNCWRRRSRRRAAAGSLRARGGRGRVSQRPPRAAAGRHLRPAQRVGAAGPRAGGDGGAAGVARPGVAGLQASDAASRGADRRGLSGRHQHAARAAGVGGAVWRGGRQGHGQPDLARKLRADWQVCAALAGRRGIIRLLLDGTVVRVRLDRRATSLSLLVALGVRRDGQKVPLAVRR